MECWAGETAAYTPQRSQTVSPGREPMEVNTVRWVWRRTSVEEDSSGDERSLRSYRQKITLSDAVRTQGKNRERANTGVAEGKLQS